MSEQRVDRWEENSLSYANRQPTQRNAPHDVTGGCRWEGRQGRSGTDEEEGDRQNDLPAVPLGEVVAKNLWAKVLGF